MTHELPPADVGADQQNEIKCGRGHLQRQPTCPACHDVVTLFNGFLGNGFTAVDPRAPSGVADPPRQELRAYVDTLRRDADDAQRRGYPEAWSALHSAATGLSQLLDAITSSPTPGNRKS